MTFSNTSSIRSWSATSLSRRLSPGSDRGQLPSARRWPRAAVGLLLLWAVSGCTGRRPVETVEKKTERGLASWYGPGFHGKRTANGEIFDTHKLTAAHRTLPFDTVVEVRNLENGRKVRVRINDRGPFVKGRIIDLAYAAAKEIEMVTAGVTRVELRIVAQGPTVSDTSAAASSPAGAAEPRYTVQVGAFLELDRAEALVDELRPQYPDTVSRSDGTWHRVQVGRFEKRIRAEKVRDELLRMGWTALVVRLR